MAKSSKAAVGAAADKPVQDDATPPPPEAAPEDELPYRPEKPVHTVRMGNIRAAIWSNVTPNSVWYNVTFSRLYKEGDDWKSSDHFGRDDLLVLAKVADRVHSWIYLQQQQSY